jgi:hypothetical protein
MLSRIPHSRVQTPFHARAPPAHWLPTPPPPLSCLLVRPDRMGGVWRGETSVDGERGANGYGYARVLLSSACPLVCLDGYACPGE